MKKVGRGFYSLVRLRVLGSCRFIYPSLDFGRKGLDYEIPQRCYRTTGLQKIRDHGSSLSLSLLLIYSTFVPWTFCFSSIIVVLVVNRIGRDLSRSVIKSTIRPGKCVQVVSEEESEEKKAREHSP